MGSVGLYERLAPVASTVPCPPHPSFPALILLPPPPALISVAPPPSPCPRPRRPSPPHLPASSHRLAAVSTAPTPYMPTGVAATGDGERRQNRSGANCDWRPLTSPPHQLNPATPPPDSRPLASPPHLPIPAQRPPDARLHGRRTPPLRGKFRAPDGRRRPALRWQDPRVHQGRQQSLTSATRCPPPPAATGNGVGDPSSVLDGSASGADKSPSAAVCPCSGAGALRAARLRLGRQWAPGRGRIPSLSCTSTPNAAATVRATVVRKGTVYSAGKREHECVINPVDTTSGMHNTHTSTITLPDTNQVKQSQTIPSTHKTSQTAGTLPKHS